MYENNPYEDYMRNNLGYNANFNMNNPMYYEDENNFTYTNVNMENMYPEIYKIIYPMICKACMGINENISEDLISRITNEIYINVENMDKVLEDNNKPTAPSSIQVNKNTNTNTNQANNKVNNVIKSDTRIETRRNNFLLRDLIRILVIRELLGNSQRPRTNYGYGFNAGGYMPGYRMPYIY